MINTSECRRLVIKFIIFSGKLIVILLLNCYFEIKQKLKANIKTQLNKEHLGEAQLRNASDMHCYDCMDCIFKIRNSPIAAWSKYDIF